MRIVGLEPTISDLKDHDTYGVPLNPRDCPLRCE